MSKEPAKDIVLTTDLGKLLRQFNEDLGQYINAEERFKLGRVLTIVDAAIADPEQRKAIKDLVNNEWWGGGLAGRPSEGAMGNPHTDLRAICEVLGFELYPESQLASPANTLGNDLSWPKKRYADVLVTRKEN